MGWLANPERFFKLSKIRQSYRLAVFFSVGYIAYECAQLILPRGIFDWKDIYGTVLGLCVTLLILMVLWRLFPENADAPSSPEHPSRER